MSELVHAVEEVQQIAAARFGVFVVRVVMFWHGSFSLFIINRHNRMAQREFTPGRRVSGWKQADGRAFFPFPIIA
ncbi:hypothetical protein F4827_003427 [Paraburkholderia bannensis]|uniref:Uncharacterized protein n=1 Tax=Paraburkholderia bannensis TaxID=765414 RepID=A0A7W9WTQ0_9BURK|nr:MULTISPECIES: hypothetical protein [Paraburkholderia]MBB3258559.1 hypothetical protein [Paraburkholderia sp. WP4_3_2]MBB6103572.1 hypothetical protein [Paraburkholderia bannensis]